MSEAKKKSFLVYGEDLKEILDELPDAQVAKLFRGMVDYHLEGKDPNFDGVLKYIFIPIRQQMDRDSERYEERCRKNRENGKLGGRSSKPNGTDRYQSQALGADIDIDIDIDKDTEKDIDTESNKVDVWSLSLSVLSHLNSVAGTNYRTDAAESVRLISDLSHKGYTEADMIAVIDKKTAEWLGDPKVQQYLRPSTLFGQKFEQYLAQPDPEPVKKRQRYEKQKERDVEAAAAYQNELDAIREKLTGADAATRIRLGDRAAWLEDEIRRLTG